MRLPRFSLFLFALCLSLFALPVARPARAQNALSPAMQRDIANLTSVPSRAPGTPGNRAAAQYVQNRMGQIGLSQVRADEFFVTTPITKFANIELNGQILPVLPVYPNQVVASTTPVGGIAGPLVYVGQGNAGDFNGKKIQDSIAVLDFNSGLNWITAIDLGARCVVFLEPEAGTVGNRGEAERKFTFLPVEVPRFYANGATATAIRGALGIGGTVAPSNATAPVAGVGPQATLKSLVVWERMPVKNILGFLPGKNPPTKKDAPNTIVINAYYDSMSVVPDLAPGAEAAGNLAAFLELATRLKANPPAYNVLFVANGAHHLALAGARNFVADHVIDKTGKADDAKKAEIGSYRGFLNLDLTSRTSTVGFFAKSWFYNQMGVGSENILIQQFSGLAKNLGRYTQEVADKQKRPVEEFFADGVTGKDGRTWRSYLPSLIALDSEVATEAGLPGVSFATANDARLYQDTPFDTVERMDLGNLAQQVETVEFLTRRSMNDIAYADAKSLTIFPTKSTLSNNFGFFTGRGIYRNVKQATSFLPDTPLPDSQRGDAGMQSVGAVVTRRGNSPMEQKSYAGVRGLMIERATYSRATKTDKQVAQFTFVGPRVGDTKGGGTPDYEFEAYTLNRDGHIIFAPDQGAERQRFSPTFNKATATLNYKDEKLGAISPDASLICFESRATTLFDTLDQRYFQVLTEMTVLDAKTDANPVEYGYLRPVVGQGSSQIEPIAVVFSKPGDRFKLIMAAGLLGKRLVLLNTDPTKNGKNDTTGFEGVGFKVPDTAQANRIPRVSYQSGFDLWVVDQQRIRLLKSFGINNERVDALHGAAGCQVTTDKSKDTSGFACPTEKIAAPNGGSLVAAQSALDNQQFDVFYREARRAFGLESRAYPDVEATSQDVLKGIIFYLALLLPFAYFVERMLFGYPDVRKQIIGTSLVFLAVFIAIRFVHPAFELALTPFIILLAFVILALTVVVTAFLQSKFEQEIKRMKQGVHYADMGRLSALGAAVGLGIANMRRRPTRTALTCITLILLTFTVLSFTSVTANIANFARPYGDNSQPPAYQGFLVRQPDWGAMPQVAVESLSNEVTARELGQPALRSWYLSRDQGEPLQLRVNNAADPNRFYYAPALLGMTPQEQTIGSPVVKTLLPGGRWFEPGDRDVALIPRDVLLSDAQRAAENPNVKSTAQPGAQTGPPLGLTLDNAVGSTIQVGGKDLKVIGVFDDRQWYGRNSAQNIRDLDNEEFSPVDYGSDQNKANQSSNQAAQQQGGETQVQRYEHMRANALLVLPYQTALDMGATTRSMAVGIADPAVAQTELDDLMGRAALGIFGATPEKVNDKFTGPLTSKLYSSVEATSYDGFAALAVPVLIAALIIANTMLGSVYERTREIGIYSSIGLAPIHIGALFIAEATVYAVLGSISGYLIAQVVAKIITATNLLPGITLNYSSSSAVIATLIVMLTVLLSTLYPAFMASKISSPEGNKNDLGEPLGDLWRLQFPFTVSGAQSLGMAQFLADYFESHTDTSVGKFFTDKVFFSGLPLRDAVALLNEGVPRPDEVAALNGANGTNGHANGAANGGANGATTLEKLPAIEEKVKAEAAPKSKVGGGYLELDEIGAAPDTQVYRLSLRTWLAPFDMGVSQDTDIILLPAKEPGLYELQLRLARRSGEISAWKRVNREFMTELRKQLLVWRTVKPAQQQEYILRGRAHIREQDCKRRRPKQSRVYFAGPRPSREAQSGVAK